MPDIWFAHSGRAEDRSDWQTLLEHHDGVARVASSTGAPLGLEDTAGLCGRFHDLGKYSPDFARRLAGEMVRVDHSTAGGWALQNLAQGWEKLVADLLGYCILGHHAGLPDRRNASDACVDLRLARFRDKLDPVWREQVSVDFGKAVEEIMARIRPGAQAAFDLSVATRMIFSCLVDADFLDTEAFYQQLDGLEPDRNWPMLQDRLPGMIAAFDKKMASFGRANDLNRLRADILAHVRGGTEMAPGLFTLTVPTGGGKTLASMGFALDHARRHGHRRIIYAIPYTSIIDQTAAIFREIFGDLVLEHHSAIDIEDRFSESAEEGGAPQGREKLRLAMENWAAPLVVTTNVQLFESLFASRTSRARKLHNIASSVIVLDEAQVMPRGLLQPTLRMIDTLAAMYGCTVVLCTATQPAFDSRHLKAGLPLEGRELAPDPETLAWRLRRARVVDGGEMDDTALVAALWSAPQGLVIVNSRRHALDLYLAAEADGLEGVIHLTTRQYAVERRRIIGEIKRRLVEGEPCRVIATSLVEAGVDLDFPCAWRAEAGLDSIIQASGRVNREDKRPMDGSTTTVFSVPKDAQGHQPPASVHSLVGDMRAVWQMHEDLLSPPAIRAYFERVYWRMQDRLDEKKILKKLNVSPRGETDFAFREIAEDFRMIDSVQVPVIVAIEPEARREVVRLSVPQVPSGLIARALQGYTVQVPHKVRALMVENGHAAFVSPDLRGDQFCVLETRSLYEPNSGLRWEDVDFLDHEQIIL